MTETTYLVTCRGMIDDGARARISLEFGPREWTGGALEPGQPFPSVPQPFQFKVSAATAQEAVDQVREIVEAAGGRVDDLEARPAPEA